MHDEHDVTPAGFAGGQGRTAAEAEQAARVGGYAFLIAAVGVVAALLGNLLRACDAMRVRAWCAGMLLGVGLSMAAWFISYLWTRRGVADAGAEGKD